MGVFVAKNTGQFLRKIAIDYVRYGYVRYIVRSIPQGKDLEAIDRKLALAYDITSNRQIRMRRRRKGLANLAYIRYRQMFVILATEGVHPEFDRRNWKDIRQEPLRYSCYTVGLVGKKVSIRLNLKSFSAVSKATLKMALGHPQKVAAFIDKVFILPFNGVAKQRDKLVEKVNKKRRRHRLSKIHIQKPEKKYPLCFTSMQRS